MTKIADRGVSYGAIGATGGVDFERFPPSGFTIDVRRARIGHGRPRFDAAVAGLRTWKVQRLSGIEVDIVGHGDPNVYRPVGFEGIDPARSASYEPQDVFDADGEPFLQPGDTAIQRIRIWGVQFKAPVRVIAVEDEPRAHAVIFGTIEGHPEAGEERLLVEHAEDDSVWIQIKAMSRMAKWYTKIGAPIARHYQVAYQHRFLDALRRVPVQE